MLWDIEDIENTVVVTMNSNSAGTMNDGFFADLNSTFQLLRKNNPEKPVILCSGAKMFSPGLDLEHCVSLFKRGDKTEIDRWFEGFLNAMLTVFNHPAPVTAAIGGHAIAGGFILALCCDSRIAGKGKTLLGLNETSIGFPMPRSLTVLVESILGEKKGRKIIDEGKLHSVEEAFENGIVNHITDPETTVSRAISEAQKLNSGDFAEWKKERNLKISGAIREAFADEDSKTMAEKLSSAETVGKLERLLQTLKKEKGRKQ